MTRFVRPALFGLALATASAPLAASAQASDPALGTVAAFNGVLVNTMKAGKSLGFAGRAQKLTPAVQTYFNIPNMCFLVVGPAAWAKMSATEKASVEAAFTRYTVANYAHNFDSYDGQTFKIDSNNVITRGPDKVVRTQIVSPGDSPTNLAYRLRQSGGGWKIIDVMYNNISQLTTQHSDFAASVAAGVPTLVAKLDAQTAKLKQ